MAISHGPERSLETERAAPQVHGQVLPGLLWAFRFDADGIAEELAIDRPIADRHDGWLWLHFDLKDALVPQSLQAISSIPALAADLLVVAEEHQQIHGDGDCVYGIFAGLVHETDDAPGDIGFFHFAMTQRLFVSGYRNALTAVDAVRRSVTNKRKVVRVGALLEAIVGHVTDAIDDYAETLATRIDQIEERILADEGADEVRLLGDIRRMATRLHRQIAISEILIRRYERDISPAVSPTLRLGSKKIGQHIEWLDSEISALRERAHVLQEEVMMRSAEETNRQLQVLAIVATVFLPASLIAGIFGMNVEGLPLTEDPLGFLWAMGLLAGTTALVLWLLKRAGILKR